MAVRSAKKKRGFHWKPPLSTAAYKIEIVRNDGTVDDVTEIISFCEVEDGVTDTIGKFEVEIYNPNETYSGLYNGMEIFRYYSDYASEATTLRFRGRAEKIIYTENKIRITGRSEALFFMDITVTQNYLGQEASTILTDLVSKYSSGFTVTNVDTSSTDVTVNWYQKPFWDCVAELCKSAGYDCYVDKDLDFHFFETSSVTNTGEAIVHGYNLLENGEFADDLSFVINRVIVYGAQQEGIQVIYTAEDSESITTYGAREEIISDSNVTDYNQAKELAEYHLSIKKDPPQIGEITGILLATIQPGERIGLSDPQNNVPTGTYDILSYKHRLDMERTLITIVKVNKEPRKFSHILKKMVERDNAKQQTTINPEEMRFSYDFLFDSDTGTHSDTEITDGVLKPTAATGTWTSPSRGMSSDIDKVYLILTGEVLTDVTVSVSGDDGNTYQAITNRTALTLSSAKGNSLKVKVDFSSADPQIKSLSMQYKLD